MCDFTTLGVQIYSCFQPTDETLNFARGEVTSLNPPVDVRLLRDRALKEIKQPLLSDDLASMHVNDTHYEMNHIHIWLGSSPWDRVKSRHATALQTAHRTMCQSSGDIKSLFLVTMRGETKRSSPIPHY